jgi:hypothetical protein
MAGRSLHFILVRPIIRPVAYKQATSSIDYSLHSTQSLGSYVKNIVDIRDPFWLKKHIWIVMKGGKLGMFLVKSRSLFHYHDHKIWNQKKEMNICITQFVRFVRIIYLLIIAGSFKGNVGLLAPGSSLM